MEPTPTNLNAAFVVAEVRPIVKAVVRKLVKDRSTRPDAEQECFLKIIRRLPTYDPAKASLKTWAHVVARSATLDLLRREARAGDTFKVEDEFLDQNKGREAAPIDLVIGNEKTGRLRTRKRQIIARYIARHPHATKQETCITCNTTRQTVLVVRRILRGYGFVFKSDTAWQNQHRRLAA